MASSQGQFTYTITKIDGKWKVVPESTEPQGQPKPGWELLWRFDPKLQTEGLEAHFQFCHSIPSDRDVCIIQSIQLNKDWAGSIPDHVNPEMLRGTLQEGVPRFHYAVWIVDPDPNVPNDFAIGTNPPPKIETGG
jgi:hypothetical protein